MKISRVSTLLRGGEILSLTVNDKQIIIKKNDVPSPLNTPAKLKARLENLFGTSLSGVFPHINRDGSIALATGNIPNTWPEDE